MVFTTAGGGANQLDTGYNIDNSLRFNDGDSPYLNRTFATPTNRKKFTFSAWYKRSTLSTTQYIISYDSGGLSMGIIGFSSADKFIIYDRDSSSGAADIDYNTTQLFRDVSAWYHIVVSMDTTDGTSGDRVKIYVNGTRVTSFDISTAPAQNYDTIMNSAVSHDIGRWQAGSSYYDGYMSEINYVDGQALDSSYFGETDDNGVWIPKVYDGTYGNSGFFLEFKQTGTSANSSGMGADTSGNDNHFSANNLAATDVTTDTPTNNFCTWNPLQINVNDPPTAFEEGNTVVNETSNADWSSTAGTQAISNGKWYWEVKYVGGGSLMVGAIRQGYASTTFQKTSNAYAGKDSGDYGFNYRENGTFYFNGSTDAGNTTFGSNDIIMIALDMDNQAIYTGKNGTWNDSGDPTSGSSKTGASYTGIQDEFYSPTVSMSSSDVDAQANFGNASYSISSGNSDANGYGNFEYAVPSGYYALCTKNLAQYG